MDENTTIATVARLFPEIFLLFHRRVEQGERKLTMQTLAILEHLSCTGPLTLGEACVHFQRSKAAMSELVKRAMGKGLLERVADPADRRRHMIWLTEEGEASLLLSRQVLCPERLQRAISKMSEEERASLVGGMKALLVAARHDLAQRGEDESASDEL